MTMAEDNRWSTRQNDFAKGAVLLVLLVLLAIVAARSPNAALDQQESPPTAAAQGQQEPSPTTAAQGQQEPTAVGTAPVLNPPQTAADGSVTLSGSAEPGSTVELWAGETQVATVPVNADGSWSYTDQLEPGDYEIVVRTVSAEGQVLNESEAVVVSVPVADAAAVTVNEPQVDASGEVILSGSAEPGSTVELWAGETKVAAVPVNADGSWSYAGQPEPGDYEIVARTVSAEGQVLNESEAVVVSVPVADAAAVTVNEPQVDASGEVILSGTGEPGSTVEILDNGVVVTSTVVGEDGAWTVPYAASAGEHTLAVQTQGQAGEGSAAASAAVTVPAAAGGHSYVVQRGDWLRKLARRYYDDWRRWTDIYEATNAKAAQDPSYHIIGDPNLLLPGWKLWIPGP
jgi:nucleoid-associated protein YgaU